MSGAFGDDAPNSLRNRVVAALAAALLLLGLTGAHAVRSIRNFSALAEKRAHHIRVMEDFSTLFSLVRDVESARRGYLLTQSEAYLAPYHRSVPRIHGAMHGLRAHAHAQRIDPDQWMRAEEAVHARVRIADESIARFRLLPEHDAEQRAIGERGRESMEEVEAAIQALMESEEARLSETEAAVRRQELYAMLVSIVGALGSAAMLFFAIASLWIQMRRRATAEREAREANWLLEDTIGALRDRNAVILRLGELSHLLQAAHDFSEAMAILDERLPRIFPGTRGALYLFRESRDHLDRGAAWGGMENSPEIMGPEDCWGLRKGFMHLVRPSERAARCAHQTESPVGLSLCIPLVAQGEARGVLYLEYTGRDALRTEERDDVPACAEQIIVALSNLQLRDRLRNQAIRDPLSGLFNRRYLMETAERELSRARREESTPVSVILMDIDHFKNFNDTYGHDAGDAVIQAVAAQLRRFVRGSDVAARQGGEEFLLWLPGARKQDAARRAEALGTQMREMQLTHGGKELPSVTLSLGVATFPEDAKGFEELLKAADLALYAAKRGGRDRVVVAGSPEAALEPEGV